MSNEELVRNLELPKRAVALVLAGGRGSRLMYLTDSRAKPAVYFGGKFRIIDFTLSNCLNSGIRRLAVVTQYKSHSLIRHIQRGWAFLKAEMNEFVDLLPAQQRLDAEHWYRGTADAVYQNLDILQSYSPRFVVVLAGDHIYKMNYALMLAHHADSGAECTVGCIEVARQEASAFGVMGVDDSLRITSFAEKPAQPEPIPVRPLLRVRVHRDVLDRAECLVLSRQLGLSRRSVALVQNEREDVGALLPAQASWIVLRHRCSDAVEQLAERQVVPVGGELATRERGCRFSTGKRRSMTRRAVLDIQSPSRGDRLRLTVVRVGLLVVTARYAL